MSEENGKVCCNCRHCIRTGEIANIQCHCDIDGSWLSYITVMTHCCKHWSREMENYSIKTVTNAKDAENYPISEDISKSIEEINKLIFENGQAESEIRDGK